MSADYMARRRAYMFVFCIFSCIRLSRRNVEDIKRQIVTFTYMFRVVGGACAGIFSKV